MLLVIYMYGSYLRLLELVPSDNAVNKPKDGRHHWYINFPHECCCGPLSEPLTCNELDCNLFMKLTCLEQAKTSGERPDSVVE
jgi:hypothetical protein